MTSSIILDIRAAVDVLSIMAPETRYSEASRNKVDDAGYMRLPSSIMSCKQPNVQTIKSSSNWTENFYKHVRNFHGKDFFYR